MVQSTSFLATGILLLIISKCMHGLHACFCRTMHAVVAAFHIYTQCGEDAAKTRGWQP